MASTATGEAGEIIAKDEELCTIEASVVTGFEESARGEAKEKFDTDVKAMRGRIIFKIPLDRVEDVFKMGSIDNFRVVMHNEPYFRFTDQHDSLARLQKMVADVDWESGLKVWKRFNDFPHPVPPRPEVVPSPDDLVDVVILKKLPAPKSKEEKKNKKGGRGKKKENRGPRAKFQDKKEIKTDLDSELLKKTEESVNNCDKNANFQCLTIESLCIEDVAAKPVLDDVKEDSLTSTVTVVFDEKSPQANDVIKASEQETEEKLPPCQNEPKTVIIKRKEDWDKDTKIDIKVLLPNPDEDAFPVKLSDKDQREVEPMEVDLSLLNASLSHLTYEESAGSVKNFDTKTSVEEEDRETPTLSDDSKPAEIKLKSKQSISSVSENEFASCIIERLTSPPNSPMRDFETTSILSPKNTGTPPPTPIRSLVSPVSDPPLLKNEFPEDQVDSDKSSLNESSSPKNESKFSETEEKGVVSDTAQVKSVRDPTKPTFRVTCNRVGDSHPFDSPSAAASFGSAIITYHKWPVDLKDFDIEVLLNIENEEVTVSLALTKMSLHNRNLVAFGPTTLRATICYNMLRLCRIKNGDFICDPMCGTGAIPIEGAMNWVNCFHFGGDCHDKAIERASQNITAIQDKRKLEKKSTLKLDAVQWNIENFPLRDRCVDVFVSDLPFGHRIGTRAVNRTLYPCLLTQMARTANTGARACLLTEDKGSLIKAIQTLGKYWQRRLVLSINIGGLSGFVFLLTRTTSAMTSTAGTWHQDQHETVDDVVKNAGVDPQSNFIKDEFGCGDRVISPTTLRTDADGRDTDSSSEGSRVEPPNPFQYESSSGETVLPTTAVDSSDTLNLQRTEADGNTFCD